MDFFSLRMVCVYREDNLFVDVDANAKRKKLKSSKQDNEPQTFHSKEIAF